MARRMFGQKLPSAPFRMRFFVKSISPIKEKLYEIKKIPIPLEFF